MRGEQLFEAISNIDARFVEEADPARVKRPRRAPLMLRRYGAWAAMLVVVIGISALMLESGLLFRKSASEEAAAPATEMAVFTTETTAEEAEYEEAYEEAVAEEAPAEPEPAAAEAPAAEAPAAEEEFAAGVTTQDTVEEAVEEAAPAAKPEEGTARTAPDSVIFRDGEAYVPVDGTVLEALPEGCSPAETISGEASAHWYTDDAALHGQQVWLPEYEEDVFYVAYGDGYVKYQKQP